jgi:hypothetical protein
VVRYSLLVRLLHPLLHAGLSRRTVNYFFRRVYTPGVLIVDDHLSLLVLALAQGSPKVFCVDSPQVTSVSQNQKRIAYVLKRTAMKPPSTGRQIFSDFQIVIPTTLAHSVRAVEGTGVH